MYAFLKAWRNTLRKYKVDFDSSLSKSNTLNCYFASTFWEFSGNVFFLMKRAKKTHQYLFASPLLNTCTKYKVFG